MGVCIIHFKYDIYIIYENADYSKLEFKICCVGILHSIFLQFPEQKKEKKNTYISIRYQLFYVSEENIYIFTKVGAEMNYFKLVLI